MDKKRTCPFCRGTGFDKPGHLCICVGTKKDAKGDFAPDLPEGWKDIFGDIFRGSNGTNERQ